MPATRWRIFLRWCSMGKIKNKRKDSFLFTIFMERWYTIDIKKQISNI